MRELVARLAELGLGLAPPLGDVAVVDGDRGRDGAVLAADRAPRGLDPRRRGAGRRAGW